MAAIVRVKRRIDEDPAEALIISCKKRRQDVGVKEASKSGETIRLNYAGTLATKDASVSTHIRDSLRRQTLQDQYKQHMVDIPGSTRAKHRAAAKASRYKIVCSKRAVDLDCLDCSSADQTDTEKVLSPNQSEDKSESCTVCTESFPADEVSGSRAASDTYIVNDKQSSGVAANAGGSAATNKTEEGVFMYDVEQEPQSQPSPSDQEVAGTCSSGITCNGVELVRRRSGPLPRASPEPFVYDLYFSELGMRDFRSLEEILYIEAMHDDLAMQADREEACEEAYDDEDDSNDESNWRNDYPDEDPHFFENDLAYLHGDMQLVDYDSYHYGDDDSLNEWMNRRCAIGEDSLSSGDEDDTARSTARHPVSYGRYMRRVNHEMTSNGSDISSSED